MSDLDVCVKRMRAGESPAFPAVANTLAYAQKLDSQDKLSHLRDEFILPTKGSVRKAALDETHPAAELVNGKREKSNANGTTTNGTTTNGHAVLQNGNSDDLGIYFVGNSLGAQPKAVRKYVAAQLDTWASIGVNGHFTKMGNSPLNNWQEIAQDCADKCAELVGAKPHEVVIMNTLSVNLHLMMASFYKPTKERFKIIFESKPFPSDYYAFESQIQWHGLSPEEAMIKLEPDENQLIPTEKILATIDQHADETAMILLPGIQYYSGQLFDIPRITSYAKARGIVVGWDLAHAVGNVEMSMHDWDVDFACWCTYKYLNAGPGAIAGAYVHERYGTVEWPNGPSSKPAYHPRLTGWYGGDRSVRFNMDNKFVPTPGASGYQLGNPSAIDLASLSGSLSVFSKTCISDLRSKALVITAYTEYLLDSILADAKDADPPLFRIITPRDPFQRGTQLSILLRDGLLDDVSALLEQNGVMCDKRKPGVIRVAPVPLYSRFEDVLKFTQVFREALKKHM